MLKKIIKIIAISIGAIVILIAGFIGYIYLSNLNAVNMSQKCRDYKPSTQSVEYNKIYPLSDLLNNNRFGLKIKAVEPVTIRDNSSAAPGVGTAFNDCVIAQKIQYSYTFVGNEICLNDNLQIDYSASFGCDFSLELSFKENNNFDNSNKYDFNQKINEVLANFEFKQLGNLVLLQPRNGYYTIDSSGLPRVTYAFVIDGSKVLTFQLPSKIFPSNFSQNVRIVNIIKNSDNLDIEYKLSNEDERSLNNPNAGFYNQQKYQQIWSSGSIKVCYQQVNSNTLNSSEDYVLCDKDKALVDSLN